MYGLIKPLVGDDFHFYNGVVSIYLQDAPGSLTEIKNWQGTISAWTLHPEVVVLMLLLLPIHLDVDCSSTEVFNESTCKDCKSASSQATHAIVIGFISQFPQIFTDLCRSKGN